MRFKQIRNVIYCPCKVIIGETTYDNINTHEKTKFDNYKIIGIRARNNSINGFSAGTYIEILCQK